MSFQAIAFCGELFGDGGGSFATDEIVSDLCSAQSEPIIQVLTIDYYSENT